jgi:hypothetical protein
VVVVAVAVVAAVAVAVAAVAWEPALVHPVWVGDMAAA